MPAKQTKPKTYSFTELEFNAFIAEWLNEANSDYVKWVSGVKLFREYLIELAEKDVT